MALGSPAEKGGGSGREFSDAAAPTEARCRDCGAMMWQLGTEQFRVGGTSGLWKLVAGELAELGESMIPLELTVCPSCRHVEIRVPSTFRPIAPEDRGLRYACPGCGGDVYQGQTSCPACGQVLSGDPNFDR